MPKTTAAAMASIDFLRGVREPVNRLIPGWECSRNAIPSELDRGFFEMPIRQEPAAGRFPGCRFLVTI
nr:hypothetical protein Ade03nite_06050 [Actinoplanes derwentensis]